MERHVWNLILLRLSIRWMQPAVYRSSVCSLSNLCGKDRTRLDIHPPVRLPIRIINWFTGWAVLPKKRLEKMPILPLTWRWSWKIWLWNWRNSVLNLEEKSRRARERCNSIYILQELKTELDAMNRSVGNSDKNGRLCVFTLISETQPSFGE